MAKKEWKMEHFLTALGEEAILEEWEQEGEKHNFSSEYNKKKKELIRQAVCQNTGKRNRKKRWVVCLCAAALLMFSVGAYAAVQIFHTRVEYDAERGFASLAFEKLGDEEIRPIEIIPGYLPEGYEEWDEGKYSPGGEYGASGLTFMTANDKAIQNIGPASSVEETILGGVKALVVEVKGADYPHIIFLLYEDLGHVVEIMGCSSLDMDEVKKVAENIRIEETDSAGNQKTYFAEEDDEGIAPEEIPIEGEQIRAQGDTFVSWNVAYTVKEARLSDQVPDERLKQEYTGGTGKDYDLVRSCILEDGTLKPWHRTVDVWDGDAFVEKDRGEIPVKYLEVTLEVQNIQDEPVKDICTYYRLCRLVQGEGETWEKHDLTEMSDEDGSLDVDSYGLLADGRPFIFDSSSYLDDPKHFYFMDLDAGETREIHVGFAVPEDRLDQLYIGINVDIEGETNYVNVSRQYQYHF
ncbi:MAG: DUF4367 domain-containing protein [Ruminococcus sp.]|jgi:hypothetical protein